MPRLVRSLYRDWRFTYRARSRGDQSGDDRTGRDGASADFDDRTWRPIALPHTWHTYETTGQVHPFTRDPSEYDDPFWWTGTGWYRKRLYLPRRAGRGKVFLEFDGVQTRCRVYLNGVECGRHRGGFTSFSVDVTAAARTPGENVIAVAVDARRDSVEGTPPMTAGNWNIYGGIYRDVRLVLTDSLHIPFQGSADAEGGVAVRTPELSAESGYVTARTWVRNDSRERKDFEIVHHLHDPSGAHVHSMTARASALPGECVEIPCKGDPIARPILWSIESPSLYRLETSVVHEGRTVDATVNPVGFRWFRWDFEERRLYLNDKPVHLHGTNRHQEYPWLGDAVPEWIHRREMHEIRHTLGHNFIRTCHYPQDPLIYRLCDELGLLCCEEVPNIKNLPFNDDTQRRMVREMVRRDRNHPSIVMWSVGNETDNAADGEWVRSEDDTRIVHARKVYSGRGSDEVHNHEQIDMENMLRCTVRGWTEGERFPPDDPHGQVTGTEECQHRLAQIDDGSIRGRIDRDTVVWLYADHGADREYRRSPLKHVNPKGWVDAYRVPKYIYHLWRANYSEELMVFVHPHRWAQALQGGDRDVRVDIVVDSSGDEVELFVGDRSVGRARPTPENFQSVTFPEVPVEAAPLRAVARRNGREVVQEIPVTGPPVRVELSASHDSMVADRAHVVLVTAMIVDSGGNRVYGATDTLEWSVEGPGRLLAPQRFVSQIDDRELDEGTFYITPPVRVPVRSLRRPGIVHVRCYAEGLAPGEVTIEARDSGDEGVLEVETPRRNEARSETAESDSVREPIVPDQDDDELSRFRGRARPRTRTEAPGSGRPYVYEDIRLDPGDEHDLRDQIDRLIRTRNPFTRGGAERYEALLTELSALARHGGGLLIADDFNSAMERFHADEGHTPQRN